MAGSGIPLSVEFEPALKSGKLDEARALLDELEQESGSDNLDLAECWADLARAFDRRREHDSAITAPQRAIELGWHTIPDARSDIAESHLRAGRGEEAARIWAELKAEDPNDVWLYNGAGLSYSEAGEHELAVGWLGEGIERAIRDGDPESIVAPDSTAASTFSRTRGAIRAHESPRIWGPRRPVAGVCD
jgi:tetratricopeptide (TPR) repeat protein